jgi:hypothetical protein
MKNARQIIFSLPILMRYHDALLCFFRQPVVQVELCAVPQAIAVSERSAIDHRNVRDSAVRSKAGANS